MTQPNHQPDETPPDETDDLEMPPDPDWQDVPPELAALDGQQVCINGEVVGTLVIPPGLFGHARRVQEGFYDQG